MSIAGHWQPRFQPLVDAFAQTLARWPQSGGAICVYQNGTLVADLFGGFADGASKPWRDDTLVMGFSTGKGFAATLFHTLVDEGLADYDAPISRYWPEFAAAGKADITVRQALAHSAGLHRLGGMIDDFWQTLDFDAMADHVARAAPCYRPGTRAGYHGISYSWLLGELIARVGKKSVNVLLQERIVQPLALDGAYFGLPEHEFSRCAELLNAREPMTLLDHALTYVGRPLQTLSLGQLRLAEVHQTMIIRASGGLSWNDVRLRKACILSSTGVFTARALAKLYAALANGGSIANVCVLRAATLDAAQTIHNHYRDDVMGIVPHWRLGYHGIKLGKTFVPGAFGHCGYRGSGAFADPSRKLSFAYLHNARGSMQTMGGPLFQKLAGLAIACGDK